ncbi:MAG: hypothetical protein O7F12_16090 [Nitrospirae bacterium]|nr:hypothetical protein [Nitrospirota bacterium]
MKRMAWNLGLVLVVMGLLAGCTSAIYNVNNATVAGPTGGTLTMPEIKKAIMTAGAGLGWNVKEESPGHLVGTLHLRTHTAVVDIPYSTETYNITYKSSSNLLYDPEDGTIHSNYNGWIENLDKAIKNQLAAL